MAYHMHQPSQTRLGIENADFYSVPDNNLPNELKAVETNSNRTDQLGGDGGNQMGGDGGAANPLWQMQHLLQQGDKNLGMIGNPMSKTNMNQRGISKSYNFQSTNAGVMQVPVEQMAMLSSMPTSISNYDTQGMNSIPAMNTIAQNYIGNMEERMMRDGPKDVWARAYANMGSVDVGGTNQGIHLGPAYSEEMPNGPMMEGTVSQHHMFYETNPYLRGGSEPSRVGVWSRMQNPKMHTVNLNMSESQPHRTELMNQYDTVSPWQMNSLVHRGVGPVDSYGNYGDYVSFGEPGGPEAGLNVNTNIPQQQFVAQQMTAQRAEVPRNMMSAIQQDNIASFPIEQNVQGGVIGGTMGQSLTQPGVSRPQQMFHQQQQQQQQQQRQLGISQQRGSGTAAGSGGAGAPISEERKKQIQQQLLLLLHAHKCNLLYPIQEKCNMPLCRTLKYVLTHMATCKQITGCTVQHCTSSRKILLHYKNCQQSDCIVCVPFRQYPYRKLPKCRKCKSDEYLPTTTR